MNNTQVSLIENYNSQFNRTISKEISSLKEIPFQRLLKGGPQSGLTDILLIKMVSWVLDNDLPFIFVNPSVLALKQNISKFKKDLSLLNISIPLLAAGGGSTDFGFSKPRASIVFCTSDYRTLHKMVDVHYPKQYGLCKDECHRYSIENDDVISGEDRNKNECVLAHLTNNTFVDLEGSATGETKAFETINKYTHEYYPPYIGYKGIKDFYWSNISEFSQASILDMKHDKDIGEIYESFDGILLNTLHRENDAQAEHAKYASKRYGIDELTITQDGCNLYSKGYIIAHYDSAPEDVISSLEDTHSKLEIVGCDAIKDSVRLNCDKLRIRGHFYKESSYGVPSLQKFRGAQYSAEACEIFSVPGTKENIFALLKHQESIREKMLETNGMEPLEKSIYILRNPFNYTEIPFASKKQRNNHTIEKVYLPNIEGLDVEIVTEFIVLPDSFKKKAFEQLDRPTNCRGAKYKTLTQEISDYVLKKTKIITTRRRWAYKQTDDDLRVTSTFLDLKRYKKRSENKENLIIARGEGIYIGKVVAIATKKWLDEGTPHKVHMPDGSLKLLIDKYDRTHTGIQYTKKENDKNKGAV